MSGPDDDGEPSFLRAPPPGPDPDNKLAARRRDVREAFAAASKWEHGVGWRGAWVEAHLGGLRVSVPGYWRLASSGTDWDIPGKGIAGVHMFGFEKSAPSVREYVQVVERGDRRGYETAGVRDVAHPHASAPAGSALEMCEHDPRPAGWPVRWVRYAQWTGKALLCLRLETDGLTDEDLGADFGRAWRSLR